MAKLGTSTILALVLAALAGCAATPPRLVVAAPEIIHPACDTSVAYIDMVGTIRNDSNEVISFHLDDDRGPPFDLWYMGYIVYSGAPGEQFRLVHYSGHDSEWDRTVTIAPGDTAAFNIPLFGLRPADYLRYFRIELRDSKLRSYWTPVFELCAVSPVNCACPPQGAPAAGPQSCPVLPLAGVATDKTSGEIGVACR